MSQKDKSGKKSTAGSPKGKMASDSSSKSSSSKDSNDKSIRAPAGDDSICKTETDDGINETLEQVSLADVKMGAWLPGFEPPPEVESTRARFDSTNINLPDAWRGSYGPEPEFIIGEDNRQPIRDTTGYPYKMLCHLVITAKSGRKFVGTGWFGGPRTIYTAGHCTYLRNEGGFASRIDVYPGRNGSFRPKSLVAVEMFTTRSWAINGIQAKDYGALHVAEESDVYFGYESLDRGELERHGVHIFGYPGDKAKGTLWGHGSTLSRVYPDQIVYTIDTFGGMSGSPVFAVINDQAVALGIHNYGGSIGNLATRINGDVEAQMSAWWR